MISTRTRSNESEASLSAGNQARHRPARTGWHAGWPPSTTPTHPPTGRQAGRQTHLSKSARSWVPCSFRWRACSCASSARSLASRSTAAPRSGELCSRACTPPPPPPSPPIDAPCTQCLRHGDPMHASKQRLTAAGAPGRATCGIGAVGGAPGRGAVGAPGVRTHCWRERAAALPRVVVRLALRQSKRLLIASRWVSKPLARGGKLRTTATQQPAALTHLCREPAAALLLVRRLALYPRLHLPLRAAGADGVRHRPLLAHAAPTATPLRLLLRLCSVAPTTLRGRQPQQLLRGLALEPSPQLVLAARPVAPLNLVPFHRQISVNWALTFSRSERSRMAGSRSTNASTPCFVGRGCSCAPPPPSAPSEGEGAPDSACAACPRAVASSSSWPEQA
jgi:hypothetical protein